MMPQNLAVLVPCAPHKLSDFLPPTLNNNSLKPVAGDGDAWVSSMHSLSARVAACMLGSGAPSYSWQLLLVCPRAYLPAVLAQEKGTGASRTWSTEVLISNIGGLASLLAGYLLVV